MHLFIWLSFALGMALLAGLCLHGGNYVRRTLPGAAQPPEHHAGADCNSTAAPTPKVAVIIPLTGNHPAMPQSLQSLLHQDYPDYELILVTQDLSDPATGLVREVLLSAPIPIRHVLSGPAVSCAQKNHNLLAGLQAVSPEAVILVFCDGTHTAAPDFLTSLTAPLRLGEAALATGFHRLIPGDHRLATVGLLITLLAIHLLHGYPRLVQPWGGATAILRRVFDHQGLARVWAGAVVDDVSLALHLARAGLRVKAVPGATLSTYAAGLTCRRWIDWLTRQILYVKFFMPFSWLAAAVAVYLLVGPVILAILTVSGGMTGLTAP